MAELFTVNALAALATLAILEIVLGIDNVVFLAILTGKLPEHQQARARTLFAEADRMVFTRPMAARNWLQASNPSERWKWDFMFQDLPPVKFADTIARKPARDIIPVTKID